MYIGYQNEIPVIYNGKKNLIIRIIKTVKNWYVLVISFCEKFLWEINFYSITLLLF